MIDGIIDGTVQLFLRNGCGFPRAPVQEVLEFLGDRRAITSRGDLLGRNGYDADFLIGVDGAAQKLLDSGLHTLRQVGRFLARYISH